MAVTFGTMKTRIQAETNRPSTANLTYIGDAIVTAIKFYEAKPIWFTEKKDTVTLSSASNNVSLPSDFKRIINLRLAYSASAYRGKGTGFDPKTMKELEEDWTDPTLSQTPVEWALFGSKIYVNCLADQSYTLPITYNYGDSTYPSADGDTSVWFEEGADIIRYKAMATFYRDKLHGYDLADKADAKAEELYRNIVDRSNSRDSEYLLS